MDDAAAAEITPHLAPGEKLLWSGRPSPGLYAWNNGAGLIVVGVMLAFGSVAGFGVAAALIVLAVALLVGVLLWFKAKSARYGLTDRRAIIATRWPWPVESLPRRNRAARGFAPAGEGSGCLVPDMADQCGRGAPVPLDAEGRACAPKPEGRRRARVALPAQRR